MNNTEFKEVLRKFAEEVEPLRLPRYHLTATQTRALFMVCKQLRTENKELRAKLAEALFQNCRVAGLNSAEICS